MGAACTDVLLPSLAVEVRDAETGAPAARGVTGFSDHHSGVTTELTAMDELHLMGNWRRELPGAHQILLRKPGFVTMALQADVRSDRCHVQTERVEVEMRADFSRRPAAPPLVRGGPGDRRLPASAGIRVTGDTLEIAGFAPTACERLRAVAVRRAGALHVQLEPAGGALEP